MHTNIYEHQGTQDQPLALLICIAAASTHILWVHPSAAAVDQQKFITVRLRLHFRPVLIMSCAITPVCG